ncbi:MAG: hypothetical protein JO345_28380 [Streptosporangiaceae bacterium]|nr:hypothetical protein [Streptosporangiaceae bacterium]
MTSDSSWETSGFGPEIRSVRSEIANLQQQVSSVSRLSDRLRRIEETVPRALDDLARKQQATQDSLDSLREMYERDRIVTAAYHELAVAERQWQAKFGRYEEARNMAASIIDVVASGHINRGVILDVTERLAIQTPRYWVAQATLAVAAWLNDNPGQHREALGYALALDYEKTSLFMALLLRDQDRDEVLQEWLAAYLSRLTPVSLPRHFQVVIDAATGNAFGGGAAPRLVKQMDEWYAEERARQDIFDAAVSEWQRRLLSLGARHREHPDFSLLAANEKAWKVLSPRYEASRAIERAARYFRERFEAGASVSDDVRGDLAALLSKLARTEDPEEEELLRVTREQRAITLTQGDLSAARAMVVADEEGRSRTLNIVGMVSQSAFPGPDDGQLPDPTVTELLAIMLSKQLIVTAAEELRDGLPEAGTIEITVGERQWECRFACDDETRTTRPALRDQAEEQAAAIRARIDTDAARRQGRLRWLKKWGCPGGLAAAVGLGGATLIPGVSPELIIPAILAGVPSVLGIGRLPRVVKRATDQAESEKRDVTAQISKAADQLADLWDADRLAAQVHLPDLRGYLGGVTPDSVRAATRALEAVPLARTREFPSWTPRPPRRPPEIDVRSR